MWIKLLLLPIFILLFDGCSSKPMKKESKVIPVSAIDIVQTDIPIFFESLGTLQASHQVEIRSQTSGILKDIHFTEGQLINKGDLLFTIDPVPAEIKVQELEAVLSQDTIHFQSAKRKLDRYRSLPNPESISLMEWDELEAQVKTKEAVVEADKAKAAAAKMELDRCYIKSPITGRVGKLLMHKGNLVTGSHIPLVAISSTDPLYVEFSLTEKEVSQITHQNIPLDISLLCDQNAKTRGSLAFLDSKVDPSSGMLLARGVLANKQETFWPGQSVRVQFQVSIHKNAQLIPTKAVRVNQNGPYVYIVKEGHAEMRQIQTGREVGGNIIINSGLQLGDLVITDGHLRLAPGTKVEVVAEAESKSGDSE